MRLEEKIIIIAVVRWYLLQSFFGLLSLEIGSCRHVRNVPFIGCNPPQRMVGNPSICALLEELFALQLYKLNLYVLCSYYVMWKNLTFINFMFQLFINYQIFPTRRW